MRDKYVHIGAPAAALGVLASTLAAVPAHAASPTEPTSVPAHSGAASLAPDTARVAQATPAPATYTVQSGDTVSAIAERFSLTPVDVLTWNGLGWRSVIYPGQTLALAAPAAPASAQVAAPAAAASTHTVVAGDTVFAIAQRYGTTVEAILTANGLGQGAIIYPGQSLSVAVAAPEQVSEAPAASPTASVALNPPQAENVALIIRIGRELGVSDHGIAIALGTSMVESWLRNLDWGDRDSLGLFQQRPSTGWGTADQIMNRDYSIRAFFTGASNPDGTITRGLLDIPGWEGMSFANAAQSVQISAYPQRYAEWETAAYEWLAQYG
ncbi:LysM peptidoglycan-binding domain-containing protein [Microbacterium sp. A196]|uniref:LysM peptidoglycan-binding domain-containing protein n=1 Tax=Microbacterium sp. A196 TaxID=3457320 RepID=UPI003FD2D81D